MFSVPSGRAGKSKLARTGPSRTTSPTQLDECVVYTDSTQLPPVPSAQPEATNRKPTPPSTPHGSSACSPPIAARCVHASSSPSSVPTPQCRVTTSPLASHGGDGDHTVTSPTLGYRSTPLPRLHRVRLAPIMLRSPFGGNATTSAATADPFASPAGPDRATTQPSPRSVATSTTTSPMSYSSSECVSDDCMEVRSPAVASVHVLETPTVAATSRGYSAWHIRAPSSSSSVSQSDVGMDDSSSAGNAQVPFSPVVSAAGSGGSVPPFVASVVMDDAAGVTAASTSPTAHRPATPCAPASRLHVYASLRQRRAKVTSPTAAGVPAGAAMVSVGAMAASPSVVDLHLLQSVCAQ